MRTWVDDRYRLYASATADGDALDPEEVDSLRLSIFRQGGAAVVSEAVMTYSGTRLRWEYTWDTAAASPDDYWARFTVVDIDGARSSEYLRIRLRQNPAL